jgi:CRISPR/Cas system-associated endoribonuclease Cas2
MEWFGPMGSTLRQKVLDIVSKRFVKKFQNFLLNFPSWFHGNLSHIQAEKLIQRNSNAKKGTFLIRFSSKNRGYFTITVVGRKRSLLHYR